MKIAPRPLCSECEASEAKIVTLFTHESFCGRACFAEGQLKYVRTVLRANTEALYENAV
jgi:hypothetical protein